MSMVLNASPVFIPWPNLAAHGTIKFPEVLTTSMTDMSQRGPQGFSGAYLFFKNDSDSGLLLQYPISGHQCFLTPGDVHSCPIPQNDKSVNWQVAYQNPYQVHPAQALNIQFYDKSDVDAGHQLIASSLANPSTPAAAIGPGTLPAGVLIPANQVSAGTFGAGVLEPGSQITGDIAASQVGPGTMDSDVIAAFTNALNGGANLPAGRLGASVDGDIVDANNANVAYFKVRGGGVNPVMYWQIPTGTSLMGLQNGLTAAGVLGNGGQLTIDQINLRTGNIRGITTGTVSIGASTSVLVNHGMNGTPDFVIACTATGSGTTFSTGTCSCYDITATQFRLANGQTATLTYRWVAVSLIH